jgi:hypothetical protein
MASVGSSKSGASQNANNWSSATSSGFNEAMGMGQQDVFGAQQPALQSLYANAQQLLQGGGAAAQQQGMMDKAAGAWAQQLQPGGNPYFSQSVQGAIDQATQGFNRQVLPGLQSNAVQAGGYGGARDQLAQGEAAGLASQGISRMVGDMYANQYGADQNRALGALGMAPQLGAMAFQPQQQAAAMIGGPTVLGRNINMSRGAQESEALSAGASTGTSKSHSFNMGIGSK